MTSIHDDGRASTSTPVTAGAAAPRPVNDGRAGATRVADATLEQAMAAVLAQAGLALSAAGDVVVEDTAAVSRTRALEARGAGEPHGGSEVRLPPPSPPEVALDAELREGAESFAINLDLVLGDVLTKGGASTGTKASGAMGDAELRKLSELSADLLVAAFLKLNITDPSNDPEVHARLQELASSLRQRAIDDARLQQAQASQAMKEARDYADRAALVGKVVMAVLAVVAVVAAVFTAGTSLALFGTAFAAFASAHAATALTVAALVALVGSLASASASETAAGKALEAQEEAVDVKVAERLAELFQEQVEDENEVVKLIMEAKNQVVGAVIEMMKALFASSSRLMAASLAR